MKKNIFILALIAMFVSANVMAQTPGKDVKKVCTKTEKKECCTKGEKKDGCCDKKEACKGEKKDACCDKKAAPAKK